MIVNSSSMKCEGIDTMFLMVLGADELATFANNLALSVTTSPEFYDAREAKLSALSEPEVGGAAPRAAAGRRRSSWIPSAVNAVVHKKQSAQTVAPRESTSRGLRGHYATE